jgi:hypothetical protein
MSYEDVYESERPEARHRFLAFMIFVAAARLWLPVVIGLSIWEAVRP